jgi:putative transposase
MFKRRQATFCHSSHQTRHDFRKGRAMARSRSLLQNQFPYHIWNRVLDQRFYPSTEEAWKVYCDGLVLSTWTRGLRIHAFVLMGNHYHLIASTPDSNLDQSMQVFQSHVSQTLIKRCALSGVRFGTRYRWSLLGEAAYIRNVYRYVYQNPLRAGLIPSCELYPWSTLHGKYGLGRLSIPIWPLPSIQGLPNTDEDLLAWINEWQGPEQDALCRRGIRRRNFSLPIRAPGSSRRNPALGRFYNDAMSDKK